MTTVSPRRYSGRITPARLVLSVTLCLGMAGGAIGTAYAQSSGMQQLTARFQAADTNHDGRLTRSEAEAGMPRVAAHFDQIDTEKRGSITLDQIVAAMQRQRGG